MRSIKYSGSLRHHGILGQKWGQRNGPPYPLDENDHSVSEKKSGWQKSLNSTNSDINRILNLKRDQITDKDISKYRELMKKHYKNDVVAVDFYDNESDEVIRNEIIRRQNIKKTLITTASVVGVGAAIYLAYCAANASIINTNTANSINNISKVVNKKALQDVEFVVNQGDTLHRIVGYSGFDLDKTNGFTYVTNNKLDADFYKAFLRDWTGSDRHEVDLMAKVDLRAPGLGTMKKEFLQKFVTDDLYKAQLAETTYNFMKEQYKKRGIPFFETKSSILSSIKSMSDGQLYAQAMWALVRGGDDANAVRSHFMKKGYNALLDFHDINDKIAEAPMIVFNAKNDLVKLGEHRVTKSEQLKAAYNVATSNHVFSKRAKAYLLTMGLIV